MQAFKLLLQRLPGIHDVHVRYSEADSRDYSGGDRVCTSIGKNVTMTFLNVTFPDTNGDVPNLTFDITNGFFSLDLRTGLSLGNRLNPLAGTNTNYLPSLVANEIQKGFKRRDGTAFYHSGSGTKTLSFRYLHPLYCISLHPLIPSTCICMCISSNGSPYLSSTTFILLHTSRINGRVRIFICMYVYIIHISC